MKRDDFTPGEAALIEAMWRPISTWPAPSAKSVFVVVEYDDVPRSTPTIQVAYCIDGHWATTHGRLRGIVTYWMPLFSPPQGVESWVDSSDLANAEMVDLVEAAAAG